MTQQDLAGQAGLTLTTVSRLENGRTRPRPRTIRGLAKALDVEPAELRRILEEGSL